MGDKKEVNLKSMFNSAQIFQHAADILSVNIVHAKHHHLFFAYAMHTAFALELFLKILLRLEGSSPGDTHDLKELFRNLKRGTKAALEKEFNAKYSKATFKEGPPMKPTNLADELERSKDAFVEMRYIFEGERPDNGGFGLHPLMVLLRRRILKLKPEWDVPPSLNP